MRPTKQRRHLADRGFMLPFVLFISILFFAGCAVIVLQMQMSNRSLVSISSQLKAERAVKNGLQQGLIVLNQRLGYLKDRINVGAPDADSFRKISNDDLNRYISGTNTAGLFFLEFLNNITVNSSTVAYQVDFTTSGENALLAFNTADCQVTIKLIPAFKSPYFLGAIEADNTAGLNNVTLRYGYEITATESATQLRRSETISSAMKISQIDKLIQINIARELSRYNLFAINNTTPGGDPMYDRTSYTGKVYSERTLYFAQDPRFSSTVEISTMASPQYLHKTIPGFILKKPDGTNATIQSVSPVALPSSVDMDAQRQICHRQDLGQNMSPNALLVYGIYRGTANVAGIDRDTSIYVNCAVDEKVRINISTTGASTTVWTVSRLRQSDDGVVQGPVTFSQDTQYVKGWVVFSEGPIEIDGMLKNNTFATVNSAQSIYIVNNLVYEGGGTSPTTVLGLVAWTGHILIKRDIPGAIPKTINLHAVLMAVDGGFGAEGWDNNFADYVSPTAYKGTVAHQGAIIRRWSIATLSTDGTKGYGVTTVYDPNLATMKSPPFFPGNGPYTLVGTDNYKVTDAYLTN